jgi:enoyl-CoA hydratase
MRKPSPPEPVLITESQAPLRVLVLNRPQALNSLTLEIIRALRRALQEALTDPEVVCLALRGAGDKGFCAGGDVKALTRQVGDRDFDRAEAFFREEYAVDLLIHHYPKPVVVLADGVTMGGGLGLAAGADLVFATERTRMAMPETRIGFFPDVGATGWLSAKCPPGYPEYLGLTGAEVQGAEAVRLGLATHLVASSRLAELQDALKNCPSGLAWDKAGAVAELGALLSQVLVFQVPANPELDEKVAAHFADKASVAAIIASLARHATRDPFCQEALKALRQRFSRSLALTFRLLRENRDQPLGEVFAREFRAAQFMIRHPDYLEGVRARVVDKDDQPVWRPATLEDVQLHL